MQEFNKLCDTAKQQFGIDIRRSNSRKADAVRIRHSIGTLLSFKYGYSTVEVGKMLKIDHTTIVYYRSMHIPRYKTDKQYAKVYDALDSIEPVDHSLEEILQLINNIP